MSEYTGQLIGGPDDGNLITASVAEIHTREIIEHKLDGPNRDTTILVCTGKYVWQDDTNYFKWYLEGSTSTTIIKED